MGSKSQTSTTNQSQTYSPNSVAYNSIVGALGQAQNAAQLPFNIPVAPVAGFSGQQQQAFNEIGQAQGMAQPYYNQASNLFNQSAQGPNISQFFNPYASAVTSQLNNIFGQQNTQNTANLVQSAGGVGADRIGVGQANMANQQGLAAGQTLSQLYAPSLQAAQQQQSLEQSAAYGQASLGSAAQNAALSGANSLLGAGGLQQQLSQAQLNAPYQQQVAQAQFPYQQAQFLAGITGALAPGLGGTTSGQGQTTTPGPSTLSQILGGGIAGAGLIGGSGGFGSNGWLNSAFGSSPSYGGGNMFTDAYGGSASNPLQGLSPSDYGFAQGGAISPFDTGGRVRPPVRMSSPYFVAPKPVGNDNDRPPFSSKGPAGANDNGEGYDSGGGVYGGQSVVNGPDVSDQPVDILSHPFIQTGQTPAIQAHQAQLNLNPPAQSNSNSGSLGNLISTGAKMAMMFANRGGTVHPFASGGGVTFKSRFPQGYADGGSPDDSDVLTDNGQPFRLAGPEAMDNWRHEPSFYASPAEKADDVTLPKEITTGAPPAVTPVSSVRPTASAAPPPTATDQPPPSVTTSQSNPFIMPSTAKAAGLDKDDWGQSFAKSPWAAVTAAGLGMMAGTSPFAGVNIGQGGLQGLKTLEQQRAEGQKDETIAQAAKRLEQEAKFHEDQYTRLTAAQKQAGEQADRPYEELTKYQQAQIDQQKENEKLAQDRFNRPYNELTMQEKAQLEETRRQHDLALVPQGYRRTPEGTLEPIPGGPHSPEQIKSEADAKRLPAMSREDMQPLVDAYLAGDHSVMTGIGRGTQGPQNIQQFWNMTAEKLKAQGMDGAQIAAAKANFMAQSAGLRVSAQREANIETAVNEARGTFPQVLQRSAELPRSNWVPVNTVLEAYRTQSGSPEQRRFGASIQAAITAYSQAMSRTGANSVYAQQHAADILSKTDGPEALKAAIEQLDTEMAIAQHAPEQTRQAILKRILGEQAVARNPGQQTGTTPTGAPKPDAATRYKQLIEGGMNKSDAYAKLHEEGY